MRHKLMCLAAARPSQSDEGLGVGGGAVMSFVEISVFCSFSAFCVLLDLVTVCPSHPSHEVVTG